MSKFVIMAVQLSDSETKTPLPVKFHSSCAQRMLWQLYQRNLTVSINEMYWCLKQEYQLWKLSPNFPFCGVNANTKSRNKDDDVWSRWPYCHSVDKKSLTCECHFKLQICDSQLLTGNHNLEGFITIWTRRSWLWTCKLWLQLKTLHLESLKIIAVLSLNCKLQCEGSG